MALVSILIIPSSVGAVTIPEGAIVKTANNPDVYIIKYKNNKQFKRLVLNPQVFESYGHLKWENVLTIDQKEMDAFVVSDFVTVYGEKDVYQLVPDGDSGSKYLTTSGYDPDSVYTINETDFRNYILQELAKINTNISNLQNTVNQLQSATPTPAPAIVYVPVYVPATPEPTPEPTPVPTPEPAFSFKIWIDSVETDSLLTTATHAGMSTFRIEEEITNVHNNSYACTQTGVPIEGYDHAPMRFDSFYPKNELTLINITCTDSVTGQIGTKTITIDTRK